MQDVTTTKCADKMEHTFRDNYQHKESSALSKFYRQHRYNKHTTVSTSGNIQPRRNHIPDRRRTQTKMGIQVKKASLE